MLLRKQGPSDFVGEMMRIVTSLSTWFLRLTPPGQGFSSIFFFFFLPLEDPVLEEWLNLNLYSGILHYVPRSYKEASASTQLFHT